MKQKKSTNQKAKPVDRAMPVIRQAKRTDVDKVKVTRTITSAMKVVPLWSTAPVIQAATTVWNTVADAMESNAIAIADARRHLATLEAGQRAHRQDWLEATKQITGAVAVACEGSMDMVHSLGFDVYAHAAAVPQGAPGGLVGAPGMLSGDAVVQWKRGSAKNGFLVQRAVDPANAATLATPIPCTKTKYKIEGAPSASVVHVRVAAIDATSSTGIGPWSEWVACSVR